jgi:hypothetical protein
MVSNDVKPETLRIAKDHVIPLITQFCMVRNELAQLLDLPPSTAAAGQAAVSWWQAQKADPQRTYREALAALASPLVISDIGINFENESLVNTHAIVPSMRWNDPVFLLAEENGGAQLKLERLQQGDILLNTILLYLQGGAPLYEMDMKFEVPLRDFIVLLGMTDLRQRLRYRALLDYKPYAASMTLDDIVTSVDAGFAFPDPRWLLSFSLPMLHTSHDAITRDTIRQSVGNLVRIGLLQNAGGENYSFTEAGERFAESAVKRKNSVRIDVYGAGIDGRNGRLSQLFIRGESLLWYAGISGRDGNSVIVAVVSLEKAEALLKELFTPAAVPKPIEPARPAPSPEVAHAAAPTSAVPQATAGTAKKFCPSCGSSIQPGKKFCPQCGVKIN